MSGRFAREKGKRAEREVCKILQPVVNEEYAAAGQVAPTMERNLLSQARSGGVDAVGLDWLAIEIKHHNELNNVNGWWDQTKEQARGREPVLFYKKTGGTWRVRMFGYLQPNGCTERVRCPVDISQNAFLAYLRVRIRRELAK